MVAKDADISSVYFSGTLGTDGSLQKSHGELEGVLGYEVKVGGLSVTGNWVANRTYTVSYSYAGYDFPRTPAGSITTTNVTNWNTAYSWGNHATAGYYSNPAGLTDLETITPDLDLEYDLGSPLYYWRNLYINSIIIKTDDFGANTGTIEFPDSSIQTTAFTSSPILDTITLNGMSYESLQSKQDATGTVVHDCSGRSIFYHTSPDSNWTVNLTNLGLDIDNATSVTLIISQGGTGYYPSALQIGGAAQTINWQGNATPTPSSNRVDVVSFNIFRTSGGYTVLGQLTGF
jgi:hypothetical protein